MHRLNRVEALFTCPLPATLDMNSAAAEDIDVVDATGPHITPFSATAAGAGAKHCSAGSGWSRWVPVTDGPPTGAGGPPNGAEETPRGAKAAEAGGPLTGAKGPPTGGPPIGGAVILFSFWRRLQNQTRTTSRSRASASAMRAMSAADGLAWRAKCDSSSPLMVVSMLVRFLRLRPPPPPPHDALKPTANNDNRSGRYQTACKCEIRHVALTVFAGTCKLFFPRLTSVGLHSALEALRLCAI